MKAIFIYHLAIFCLITTMTSNAQVTAPNNLPSTINYVGFNATSQVLLPIRNDGDPRIHISSNGLRKFTINELPVWNGLNGLTKNDVQRTTLGLHGESNLAWSMLHLVDNDPLALTQNMYRPWFNVGTSYTANQDFLYTGLLERPGPEGDGLRTDAVFAWGCQHEGATADNMRFIFLQPANVVNPGPGSAEQGLEIMRLHPIGNVGISSDFSNTLRSGIRPAAMSQKE